IDLCSACAVAESDLRNLKRALAHWSLPPGNPSAGWRELASALEKPDASFRPRLAHAAWILGAAALACVFLFERAWQPRPVPSLEHAVFAEARHHVEVAQAHYGEMISHLRSVASRERGEWPTALSQKFDAHLRVLEEAVARQRRSARTRPE